VTGRPSKPISKTDDASKQVIIELLKGNVTGGFDIDSIYYISGEGWVVMEFLKCDTVRPFDSHPNRYWFKNKQKFLSLWKVAQTLGGKLLLVNYEDSREQFLLLEVQKTTEDKIWTKDSKMNFEEFSKYFIEINNKARQ